jgi:uncharacterized protein YeaO (DUF488 family)
MAKRTTQYSSPACLMHELDEQGTRSQACDVRIKRVYDKPERKDGFRVLVDRLWPRGLTKQAAHLDAWLRDVAPSTTLRKWYAHDPSKWPEFRKRYRTELKKHVTELTTLRARAAEQPVTLLYASREHDINHAVVLKEAIEALSDSR